MVTYNFGIPFTTLKLEPPCTAYCRTQESIAQQLSFEWTHLRISSTDSEQDHRKVLLSRFHFNGRFLGLYPDSKVRTTLYSVIMISITKITAQQLSFKWSYFGIPFTDSKVRTTLYSISSATGNYFLVAFIELCSHFRISSTDSKVRTNLCSINSTTGKYCSVAFI